MKHQVTFRVPQCELSSSDIHIQVREDGSMLGKLEVSKGAIVWYSRDMTYGHKMTWAELDTIMQEYPRKEKRKQP